MTEKNAFNVEAVAMKEHLECKDLELGAQFGVQFGVQF